MVYVDRQGEVNSVMTGLIKIDKRAARKLFKQNGTVILVPSKLIPSKETAVSITSNIYDLYADNLDKQFEAYLNQAIYYNCNSETGKTMNYYKSEA